MVMHENVLLSFYVPTTLTGCTYQLCLILFVDEVQPNTVVELMWS